MLLATWNVNSIRARLPKGLGWVQKRRPDVLCLQEIKCLDEQFPREVFEDLISCMQSTSGFCVSSQPTTRSSRARTELTFQVATFMSVRSAGTRGAPPRT